MQRRLNGAPGPKDLTISVGNLVQDSAVLRHVLDWIAFEEPSSDLFDQRYWRFRGTKPHEPGKKESTYDLIRGIGQIVTGICSNQMHRPNVKAVLIERMIDTPQVDEQQVGPLHYMVLLTLSNTPALPVEPGPFVDDVIERANETLYAFNPGDPLQLPVTPQHKHARR